MKKQWCNFGCRVVRICNAKEIVCFSVRTSARRDWLRFARIIGCCWPTDRWSRVPRTSGIDWRPLSFFEHKTWKFGTIMISITEVHKYIEGENYVCRS